MHNHGNFENRSFSEKFPKRSVSIPVSQAPGTFHESPYKNSSFGSKVIPSPKTNLIHRGQVTRRHSFAAGQRQLPHVQHYSKVKNEGTHIPFLPTIKRALGLDSIPSLGYGAKGQQESICSHPESVMPGYVPYVRLGKHEKHKISGMNPSAVRSPNTVRIAPPDPSRLCSPRLLEVKTSSEQRKTLDTQSVLTALRDKRRKRSAAVPESETSFSDIPIQKAKRRRQESQQSNSSDSSLPLLPDNLPDLSITEYRIPRLETPTLKRPATPDDNDVTWEGSHSSAKRICRSSHNNSIISSLSSSRNIGKDNSLSNSPKLVRNDNHLKRKSEADNKENKISKLADDSEQDTSFKDLMKRADTIILSSMETPEKNGQNDSSDTTVTVKSQTKQPNLSKRVSLNQSFARKRNMSFYSDLNKSFTKVPKSNVVASIEDYETDRKAEEMRIQQMLEDIGKEQDKKNNQTAVEKTAPTQSTVQATNPVVSVTDSSGLKFPSATSTTNSDNSSTKFPGFGIPVASTTSTTSSSSVTKASVISSPLAASLMSGTSTTNSTPVALSTGLTSSVPNASTQNSSLPKMVAGSPGASSTSTASLSSSVMFGGTSSSSVGGGGIASTLTAAQSGNGTNSMKSVTSPVSLSATISSLNNTTSAAAGFSFGGASNTQTKPAASVSPQFKPVFGSVSSTLTNPATSTTPHFTPVFGNVLSTQSSAVQSTTASQSFGQFNPASQNVGQSVSTMSSASSQSSFGITTATLSSSSFAFGGATQPGKVAATPLGGTMPSGTSVSGSSAPVFGKAMTSPTSQTPVFPVQSVMAQSSTIPVSSQFAFGNTSGTASSGSASGFSSTPLTSSFSFGGSAAPQTASTFGASAPQTGSIGGFGGFGTSTTMQTSTTSNFTFTATGTTAGPTFGSQTTQAASFSFTGTVNQAGNTPVFGAQTGTTNLRAATPNAQPTFGTTQQPSSKSSFGVPTPSAASFSFGVGQGQQPSANPTFGTSAPTAQVTGATFGTSAPTAQVTGPTFGAPSTQAAPVFKFNSTTKEEITQGIFGSASSSFGGGVQPNVNPFGTATTGQSSGFGASSAPLTNGSTGNNTGGVFAFGSNQTPQKSNSGFNFNSSTPASFNFGTQNASFGAGTPVQGFGGNTPTPAFGASTPAQGGNMFSLGAAGGTPAKGRVVSKAKRRGTRGR